MSMAKEYLSVSEAAKVHGCSQEAIWNHIRRGNLAWDASVLDQFGAKRIKKQDMDNFMSNQNQQMVKSRRNNAYTNVGILAGYMTLNQFATKYNIKPYQLRKLVKANMVEYHVSAKGWRLLPEQKTCEKLKVGEYGDT